MSKFGKSFLESYQIWHFLKCENEYSSQKTLGAILYHVNRMKFFVHTSQESIDLSIFVELGQLG
jgi:hypothetical protein